MFVWKKKYEAVTREMGRQIVERDDTLMIRDATIGRLQRENAGLLRDKLAAAEAAKNLAGELRECMRTIDDLRPDAEKYRERLRRDRDNAASKRARSTANLIPGGAKKKAQVLAARAGVKAPELPDGLYEINGAVGFNCNVCDNFTEWNAEVSDFKFGGHENVCGGSPRCCP